MEAAATRPYPTRVNLRWLAFALLLHAALLSLPVVREHAPAHLPRPLTVELHRLPLPAAEPEIPDSEHLAPPANPVTPPGSTKPLSEPRPVDTPPAATQPLPGAAPATAARLLELAREAELDAASPAPQRRLGAPPPRPRTMARDAPTALGTRLAESFAPSSPEIVDRWLAADGSHNVVVVLPNGETVCGRGEAWDPTRPLVEHVMMFRSCGGGGRRTFSMPESSRPAYGVPD